MQENNQGEHNKYSLLIYVFLTFFVVVLKLMVITTEGKEYILRTLPTWVKEGILVKVGNAYTQNQEE